MHILFACFGYEEANSSITAADFSTFLFYPAVVARALSFTHKCLLKLIISAQLPLHSYFDFICILLSAAATSIVVVAALFNVVEY